MSKQQIVCGDCLEIMKEIPDNSIDSIVTDPPYEIGFMGKTWDNSGIAYNVDMWKECLRVLKPGGYLLSFSGTRTYHRIACAIEDSGFEVRDMIEWIYGSGFPKSLDISKALDKKAGAEREVIGHLKAGKSAMGQGSGWNEHQNTTQPEITAPSSPEAKEWEGWGGTALKPAHEPIVVARKPLSEKTVAENILKWKTGRVNIDESRITVGENDRHEYGVSGDEKAKKGTVAYGDYERVAYEQHEEGRFPANLIHDGSEEVLDEFAKYGESKSNARKNKANGKTSIFGSGQSSKTSCVDDSGTPARFFKSCEFSEEDSSFFYSGKVSKKERNNGCEELEEKDTVTGTMGINDEEGIISRGRNPENQSHKAKNNHPTVKPIKLMQYLIKMVTHSKGIVLDPFTGSGTTGIACKLLNINFFGIEKDENYFKIAETRLENYKDK